MAAIRESTLTRVQIASLTLLATIFASSVFYEVHLSDAPFLTRGIGAAWIGYPFVPSSDAIPVVRDDIPAYAFQRSFDLAAPPPAALLSARGLRSLELSVNGSTVLWDPPLASWKQTLEVDIAAKLQPGHNDIRVRVRNPSGPALLQLRVAGEGLSIVTDSQWRVSSPGLPAANAALADDTQRFADAFIMPNMGDVFRKYALVLGALFLTVAGLSALAQRRLPGMNLTRLPEITLGLVCCYWFAVFVFKISQLPVMMGFDIPAHLEYLDYLIEERSLPRADQSWSTYHPPLFYLLTTALVLLFDVARDSGAGQVVYRIVGFASGLTTVWATWLCARRYFEYDPVKTAMAVAFAGLLPMNLYVSAYVSNESLLAAWSSIALLIAIDALLGERRSFAHWLCIGSALGLAISTKFSGLILVPAVTAVVAVGIALLDGDNRRAGARRGLVALMVMLGATAFVGGAWYLRNYLQFGEWVIWNVNLPSTITWWEYPGFHTASYYLRFGESLAHPFYSGFHSFWDGIYSTFWGDGLLAGMASATTRHPFWNYDFMTLGYWTALPATLIVAIGTGVLLVQAFRAPTLRTRVCASFVFVVIAVLVFSLMIVTFRVPYYAQAKAFYILGATLPLSIAAALGLAKVDQWLASSRATGLRIAYHGWLGTAVSVIVLTYLG
ncbi:MAG: hypothetical protein GY944_27580 [bacterium]|nr:hypothetical protein [bacterium]